MYKGTGEDSDEEGNAEVDVQGLVSNINFIIQPQNVPNLPQIWRETAMEYYKDKAKMRRIEGTAEQWSRERRR